MTKYFQRIKQMGCIALCVTSLICLPALANGATNTPFAQPDPTYAKSDPLEGYNKIAFRFNTLLDDFLFKPAAEVYNFVLPSFARTGVKNFFNNVGNIPTIINDVLQLDIYQATSDSWRLAINTTIGIGGLFDVAELTGLEPHENDFGITLATWGWQHSSYLVIPVIGPSTIRDGVALPVGVLMTPYPYILDSYTSNALFLLNIVNVRSQQLAAEPLLQQLSVDKYVFLRDAYLQRRNHQIGLDEEITIDFDPYVETEESGKPVEIPLPEDEVPAQGAVGRALTF